MSQREAKAVVLIPGDDASCTQLGVIRSLGRARVPICAVSAKRRSISFSSRYVQQGCWYPGAEATGKNLAEWLVELVDGWDPQPVLHACSDETWVFANRNADLLRDHLRFHYVDPPTVSKCIDKWPMVMCAQQAGLYVPGTALCAHADDVERVVAALAGDMPCVMKPSSWIGEGASGSARRDTLFLQAFGCKGLRLASTATLRDALQKAMGLGIPVLAQQELIGPDENVYLSGFYANRDSDVELMFESRKLRQFPSDFGVGVLAEATPGVGLEEPTRAFVKASGFQGAGCIEWKRVPEEDKFYFIEINPRPWMFTTLAVITGANVVHMAHCKLTGEAPPPYEQTGERRQWINFMGDLQHFLAYRRGDHLGRPRSLGRYLKSALPPKEGAYLVPDDPLPGLRYAGWVVASQLQRHRSRERAKALRRGKEPTDGDGP